MLRSPTLARTYLRPRRSAELGIGGPCASRFTPAAAYWCASNSEGGGPGPYEAPVGMVVSNTTDRLPHTPYAHGAVGAAVHSWRAGRWFR